MYHLIFLITITFIWLVFASVHDLRKRIVPDWLSFSLIIFVLGFRFFYSLFNENFAFFYQGLIGLGIFFVIGNLLYYCRMFAGGDAKLMIAMGPIIGFSESFFENLETFLLFLILFLIVGGIYGLIWSVFLVSNNFKSFKKEFIKQFNDNKTLVYTVMIFSLIIMIFGLLLNLVFYLGLLMFILPYFYLYARSIDNSCLIKDSKVSELEEGDWLYKDLKLGKKIIKAKWEGLTKEQIKLIRKKYRKIRIREGIPFVPTFLISFLFFVYIYLQNFNVLNFFN